MRSTSVKSIRSRNTAVPALAGVLAASVVLVGAMLFATAGAAPARPDRAIRFDTVPATTAALTPAPAPILAAMATPLAADLPAAMAIETAELTLPIPVSATPAALAPRRPRIALVIDDVGLDQAAAARVLALEAALTIAILPYADAAAATARTAQAGGRDVLVHVPMEPLGLDDPGPHALRVDLEDADLRARIRWAMARVPGAVGLNNHMGSRFTRDPRALRVALAAIAEQAPLFVDSMTTADSRGVAVAQGLGLPVLQRDIFLDHVIETGAIHARLVEAETLARSQGYAVLIGHPHAVTLDALESWIGQAEEAGFEFLTVTTLSAQLTRERTPQITASIAN